LEHRVVCRRHGVTWEDAIVQAILQVSGGYPALLRAVCEAYTLGVAIELADLLEAPPVQSRLAEFWSDQPDELELQRSRLLNVPLLVASRPARLVEAHLTAKEQLLLDYLHAHPDQVCDKDDLIRAVWPEDRVFREGVRDDSLAQVVRRLREKIEIDPSTPRLIRTVPGRGYTFRD